MHHANLVNFPSVISCFFSLSNNTLKWTFTLTALFLWLFSLYWNILGKVFCVNVEFLGELSQDSSRYFCCSWHTSLWLTTNCIFTSCHSNEVYFISVFGTVLYGTYRFCSLKILNYAVVFFVSRDFVLTRTASLCAFTWAFELRCVCVYLCVCACCSEDRG